MWVRAYWFSVTSFSKWLPGGHIRFLGFWKAWFRQQNSGLLWNFSFKFHVHVFCGCRQKPDDCQLCCFQNGCLVILNNVQLQSTHCCPLLWGGGILVNHWSTISSCFSGEMLFTSWLHNSSVDRITKLWCAGTQAWSIQRNLCSMFSLKWIYIVHELICSFITTMIGTWGLDKYIQA